MMGEPASPVNEKASDGIAPPGAACVTRLPHGGRATAWHFAAGQEQVEGVMTDATDPRAVGRVPFTGGTERDVYEDADGRQWIVGNDGERVCGVWVMPADEPLLVAGTSR
jgi:hypothetical protein